MEILPLLMVILFVALGTCDESSRHKAKLNYHYPVTVNPTEKFVFQQLSKFQNVLESKKLTYDGHIGFFPNEILDYVGFASHFTVKNVVEVGFNAGHSSIVILASNQNLFLNSFTLQAVKEGVDFVLETYPGRFNITMGRSEETLKKWLPTVAAGYIDLMIIDGNHDYPAPREDFLLLLTRARVGTRYIFDGATKDCDDVVQAGWAVETKRGAASNPALKGQDEVSVGHRAGMTPNDIGTHGTVTSWCMGVIVKVPSKI
mmetsp:Transcript_26628/g.36681  ORF Transcript_26628/g.36681 Transcript_26628/m.36681 type:complete len:259 (+) Transcript_26628:56-832(+)